MKRVLAVLLVVGLIYGLSFAENMHDWQTEFFTFTSPWLIEEYSVAWDSGFCDSDTPGVRKHVDTLDGEWRHIGSKVEEFCGLFSISHACTSANLDSADSFLIYIQSCIDPINVPTVYTIHQFTTLTDTGTQFFYEPIESLMAGVDVYGDWVRLRVIHSVQIDSFWCRTCDTNATMLGVDPTTIEMQWRKVK